MLILTYEFDQVYGASFIIKHLRFNIKKLDKCLTM